MAPPPNHESSSPGASRHYDTLNYPRQHDFGSHSAGHLLPEHHRHDLARDQDYQHGRHLYERHDRYHHQQRQFQESAMHKKSKPNYTLSASPRTRISWPPAPKVEDEVASLRSEAGSEHLLKEAGKEAVQNRGTIDQQPIIMDSDTAGSDASTVSVAERSSSSRSSSGILTPPTSEDERDRRTKSRPSRQNHASSSQAHLKNPPSRASQPSAQYTRNLSSNTSSQAGEEYRHETRTAVQDFATLSSDVRWSSQVDARRPDNVSSQTSGLSRLNIENINRHHILDSARSMTDSPASYLANSQNRASQPIRWSRESSYSTKTDPLPDTTSERRSFERLQSNRSSWASLNTGANMTLSRPPSRQSTEGSSGMISAPSSRPPTPNHLLTARTPLESPRVLRVEMDWSAVRRPTRGSRLPSSILPGSPATGMPSAPTSPLPYPEDDMMFGNTLMMPDEQNIQYFSARAPAATYPGTPITPMNDSNTKHTSTRNLTTIDSAPAERVAHRGDNVRLKSATDPLDTQLRGDQIIVRPREVTTSMRADFAKLRKQAAPHCRTTRSRDSDIEWYTLKSDSKLRICADCVSDNLERTFFRPLLRRTVPGTTNSKTRCAFASRWSRVAWDRTLKKELPDFGLLDSLAEAASVTDPCPIRHDLAERWYGLRDGRGGTVPNFRVCIADLHKLERMLPTVSCLFVLVPTRIGPANGQACALREGSPRFRDYIRACEQAHDEAVAKQRSDADGQILSEFAAKYPPPRPCPRDSFLIQRSMYILPDVQDLTVCEECYVDYIEQHAMDDKRIARDFELQHSPASYSSDGGKDRSSTSTEVTCHFQSSKMRQVFREAMQDRDTRRLDRKATQYREDLLRRRDRRSKVARDRDRLQREGRLNAEQDRYLDEALRKIDAEFDDTWSKRSS